jgi:hypothetical protein
MKAMDLFVGFTRDILDVNHLAFLNEYNVLYPHANSNVSKRLNGVYQTIIFQCEILVDGYEEFKQLGVHDSFLEANKIFWLLCNIPFNNFPSQLRSFIFDRNDLALSDEDYVLLFYVSLQEEKIQNAIQNLPLSIKYDMFMPIAEENLRQWKLQG